jgi:acyl-coenzyme A synthetase/AMP-(fatty) acid ligase
MKNNFGISPGDIWWAASDLGWVVGHSYILYAPLFNGSTTVLYEGKPVGTPDAGAFWRVIQQHKVKALFTAPTAFRAIKKEVTLHSREYHIFTIYFRTLKVNYSRNMVKLEDCNLL